ncbi:MAG: hypothetical protein MJZ94_09465 [Bacteroidales bacterium]|nr:hypothetical protein [Bacteroidales bacterium]
MMRHYVTIQPDLAMLDGKFLESKEIGSALLVELYRNHIGDYPKFFKMDALCRVGFVASELLLQAENNVRFEPCDDRAVIFFNQSGSLNADTHYQATIQDPGNFFPSPAAFVYTLPNIVTGEIAIRNKYYGETSFIVLEQADSAVMARQLLNAFLDSATQSIIGGWINCDDDEHFDARLFIIERNEYADVETLAKDIETIKIQ